MGARRIGTLRADMHQSGLIRCTCDGIPDAGRYKHLTGVVTTGSPASAPYTASFVPVYSPVRNNNAPRTSVHASGAHLENRRGK